MKRVIKALDVKKMPKNDCYYVIHTLVGMTNTSYVSVK